jgi:hypothetical protein
LSFHFERLMASAHRSGENELIPKAGNIGKCPADGTVTTAAPRRVGMRCAGMGIAVLPLRYSLQVPAPAPVHSLYREGRCISVARGGFDASLFAFCAVCHGCPPP